jgi:hypothetical protein
MNLTPPKKVTFWFSIILGVLGIVGTFAPTLPVIGTLAFWFLLVGFVLLAFGNLLKGL